MTNHCTSTDLLFRACVDFVAQSLDLEPGPLHAACTLVRVFVAYWQARRRARMPVAAAFLTGSATTDHKRHMAQEPQRKMYSTSEVAEMLGLSSETVRRLVERGELPGVKLGGQVLVQRAAVDELVERGGRREAGAAAEEHAHTNGSPRR